MTKRKPKRSLLLAESGSTKTDWVMLHANGSEKHFKTNGINPSLHKKKAIRETIGENSKLVKLKPKEIYYYGAACSSPLRKKRVKSSLSAIFPDAEIQVDHDLKAAVIATTQMEKPSMVAILGTGSNACYFNGTTIEQHHPALGYVLGDEGGGVALGKRLIAALYHNELPAEIKADFEAFFNLNLEKILQNTYRKPNANRFIASTTIWMEMRRKAYPVLGEMIQACFAEFVAKHLCCYALHKQIPFHAIGSVAYYFKDELEKALNRYDIELGTVLKSPLEGLLDYHCQ